MKSRAATSGVRIATEGGLRAQREVATLYNRLKILRSKIAKCADFWNVEDSASGNLRSCAILKDGTPVWRLCPAHAHCIALAVKMGDDLFVLEICSRDEIDSVEGRMTSFETVDQLVTADD
jgi:hypothetical protein